MWHTDTLAEAAAGALHELKQAGVLDDFYLAGGTGLALYLGHRRSRDLDFFSATRFQEDALVAEIQHLGGFALTAKAPHTLHGVVQSARVSFLSYPYPALFPFADFSGVNVADPRDIACMKISAIASRGTRRDFVDLHAVSKLYRLAELLDLFQQKYAQVSYSMVHALKSLTYFDDADKDPLPDMLVPLDWDEVKRFFVSEAVRIL